MASAGRQQQRGHSSGSSIASAASAAGRQLHQGDSSSSSRAIALSTMLSRLMWPTHPTALLRLHNLGLDPCMAAERITGLAVIAAMRKMDVATVRCAAQPLLAWHCLALAGEPSSGPKQGPEGSGAGHICRQNNSAAPHRGAHRPETSNPGMGKLPAHSSTRRRMSAITGLASMPLRAGGQAGSKVRGGRQVGIGWVDGFVEMRVWHTTPPSSANATQPAGQPASQPASPSPLAHRVKSASFLPLRACSALHSTTTSCRKSAMVEKSAGTQCQAPYCNRLTS